MSLMNSQLLLIKWKHGSFNSWCLSWNLFFLITWSKIRVRIIQGRALYTGKYGIFLNPNHSLHNLKDAKINSLKLTTTNHPIWCIVALGTLKCCKLKDYFTFRKARSVTAESWSWCVHISEVDRGKKQVSVGQINRCVCKRVQVRENVRAFSPGTKKSLDNNKVSVLSECP